MLTALEQHPPWPIFGGAPSDAPGCQQDDPIWRPAAGRDLLQGVRIVASNAVKRVFRFFAGGGGGSEIVDFGPLPGPTRPPGAWERPRTGPRSIRIDVQLGRPIPMPFREVF